MKKNGFLMGAFVSTLGIVICKALGLVYVIPFYAIIGVQGGALYSYAYSLYNVFLNLATSGIPIAMSKVVSEFNELKYYFTKERAYKIGIKIISFLALISFLSLFIFAEDLAHGIIGDVEGGNSIEDVTFVIRIISTAILVVPFLSVSKGYLQGHKIMTVSSVANIIEQIVRVTVIVLGSFLAVKVFHLSIKMAVGIAVFSATIGALTSTIYVKMKIKKERKNLTVIAKEEEKKITNASIMKKIISYAFPFVVISLLQSGFTMVDVFTVVKSLTNLGYSASLSENVLSVIATWGTKLNMIVMSVANGIIMSLIPAIAGSYIVKNYKEVNDKITKAIQALLLVTVPLSVGMSFMASSVWTVFYGYNVLNISLFSILILSQIPLSIFSVMLNTNQTINNTKATISVLAVSVLTKICLNVPFMKLFSHISLEAYYAPIILNIIIDTISCFVLLSSVKKKTNINYLKSGRTFIKVILSTAIMIFTLMILNLFIPADSQSRIGALLECILYGAAGIIVYFFVTYKSGLLKEIIPEKSIEKIFLKFKKH